MEPRHDDAGVARRVVGDGRFLQPRQVERCRVQDNYRQVVSGYNVVYRYRGRDFTTMLPYDPGNTLDLNVSATVAQNQGNY